MKKLLISILLLMLSAPAFAVIIKNINQQFRLSKGQAVMITETLEQGETVKDFKYLYCTMKKVHQEGSFPENTIELKADGQVRYLYRGRTSAVPVNNNLLGNLIIRKSFSFGIKSDAEKGNVNDDIFVICNIQADNIVEIPKPDKIITPF